MQYDNYLHIAKCTNFIAPDQFDRLLDDCACWFSLHELSLTGRFSKPRRFSKIRSYPPRVELGQRHWARQSKAARAQCGQRCPLCGTTAPPSFSGNGAIGSTCAAYCLLHTSVQCRVNKHLSQCSRVTGMRAGALYQSFFSTIWNYSRNGRRERELNYLFFISLSLSLSLPLSHTHTHTCGLENIMNN